MKLKQILTTAAAFCLLLTSAMAEEAKTDGVETKKDNPPTTLFSISDSSFSGYGGVYTRYSKIGEADSCLVGGRGGVIINDTIVLGLGGMGLAHPTDRENISGIDYSGTLNKVGFGYGGFLAEYYFNPKDLIVFSTGALIGGGSLAFYEDNNEDDKNNHTNGDNFFVLEPELNVFVNITRFCRIGVGASYRYVAGINSEEFSDKDFRGASASIMAQFGWF